MSRIIFQEPFRHQIFVFRQNHHQNYIQSDRITKLLYSNFCSIPNETNFASVSCVFMEKSEKTQITVFPKKVKIMRTKYPNKKYDSMQQQNIVILNQTYLNKKWRFWAQKILGVIFTIPALPLLTKIWSKWSIFHEKKKLLKNGQICSTRCILDIDKHVASQLSFFKAALI